MAEVLGEINGCHPTCADLTPEAIPIGERRQ
jgi:hypothetical protein